jgi:hypothetical protein
MSENKDPAGWYPYAPEVEDRVWFPAAPLPENRIRVYVITAVKRGVLPDASDTFVTFRPEEDGISTGHKYTYPLPKLIELKIEEA